MPEQKPDQPAPASSSPPPEPPKEEDTLDSSGTGAKEPAQPAAGAPADGQPAKPPKSGPLKKLSPFQNLYLLIFVLLVGAGGAVLYVSMKSAKSQTNTNTVGSLTDKQLSSIKGNTTLVGDAKQTLDVQSNSIFEGQVLLRSSLDVAGSLKVGGAMSLPSLSVGGNGTFGQLGVNGGLNVAGDTTLQGQLTVQKNLSVSGSASFGSLSVSTLSVTSLNLRGNISVNEHIVTSGGVPSRSYGTALGGGGTASVNGSDSAGTVSINTGGNPAAGCFVTINFVHAFSATPHVVISPSNTAAATVQYYTTSRSASGFSICTADKPAGGTNYVYDYIVIQ